MIFALLGGVAKVLKFIAAKLEDLADWILRRSPASGYPLLPQNDPEINQRQKFLHNARNLYQYNYTYIESLPLVETVPTNERFSLSWGLLVGKAAIRVLLNERANPLLLEEGKQKSKAKQQEFSKRLLAASTAHSESALLELLEDLPSVLETPSTNLEGVNIEEYNNLFWIIPLPAISQNYISNTEFARLRVAGFNPLVIQRIAALESKFPLTEQQFQQVLPNDSLATAGAEGRLYLADYAELEVVLFPQENRSISMRL